MEDYFSDRISFMSGAAESSHEHQVGITNAQEKNPDLTIAELTVEMNARFAAGD